MEPPIHNTGNMIKRLQARHHQAADAAFAEIGVSLVQWDALRHMHNHSAASLHELAQLTFQTDQSFGALAGRLEARGLIKRVPAPGRAIRHELTDEGVRVRATGSDILEYVLNQSFSPLTPAQRITFDKLLRKLLAA